MDLQPRPLSSASSEFVDVAQAQFSMLGGSGLQISRAAVYLRREDDAGVLEFIPVAVWPEQGVWVVGGSGSSDVLDQGLATIPTPMLPGGATAESLLPRYPFMERGSSTMADAGLSVPLVYNNVVLGVLAVWRQDGVTSSEAEWGSAQRNMLEQVARTLAIAAILDQQQTSKQSGRGQAAAEGEAWGGGGAAEGGVTSEQADVVLREVQILLHMSVHQLRSPLSAVRTLSKLLLRRLDGDAISREVRSHCDLTAISLGGGEGTGPRLLSLPLSAPAPSLRPPCTLPTPCCRWPRTSCCRRSGWRSCSCPAIGSRRNSEPRSHRRTPRC